MRWLTGGLTHHLAHHLRPVAPRADLPMLHKTLVVDVAKMAGVPVIEYPNLTTARMAAGPAGLPPSDAREPRRPARTISPRVGREWTVIHDGVVPGDSPGETIEQVAARADAVVARVRPVAEPSSCRLLGWDPPTCRWRGCLARLPGQVLVTSLTHRQTSSWRA